MRPVPIPDRRIWLDPHGVPLPRRTLGAPQGLENDVRPIEALVERHHALGYGVQYHLLLQLEDQDLARLTEDPHCWLTFWGGVVPFCVTVPQASERPLLGYLATVDGRQVILDPADVQLVYADA